LRLVQNTINLILLQKNATYALPLTFLEWKFLLKLLFTGIRIIIGQSHDFWRAYSLFVARIASFAPERSEVANDATRDTIKLYACQKSCDYHYIIICNTQGEIFAAASKMKTQQKPNKLN